ncbi:hypothetical protein JDN40_04425 [Rhodomicrobium vannielii ATCC 17100]|uniref:hypothetical protein n=1 Tax=Rhodomicrobium vannielii TaxID=1069 RepID=UPI00191B01EC|nr:hypothetical protein [Rhodomicrobium vannielii]MBJ7533351.1 hypothetical protein [Rhodomicrobium vannielii ATCC 17100]
MRFVYLKAAMLSAVLSCPAGFPAHAEEERDSYLPPKELVGKAEPLPAKKAKGAAKATGDARVKSAVARQQTQAWRGKRYVSRNHKRVLRFAKGGYAKRYIAYEFPMRFSGAY